MQKTTTEIDTLVIFLFFLNLFTWSLESELPTYLAAVEDFGLGLASLEFRKTHKTPSQVGLFITYISSTICYVKTSPQLNLS